MTYDAQFGTPNAVSPQVWACHSLRIPENLRPQIVGAIAALFIENNWYDDGDLSPTECVQLCLEMFSTFEQRCDTVIGQIMAVAIPVANLPSHLLPCDNSQYLLADYPELAAVIAPEFKQVTTFRTPDLRARVVAGVGTDGTLTTVAMNGKFGSELENVSVSFMAQHSHVYNRYGTTFIPLGELAPIQAVVPPLTSTPSTANAGGNVANNKFQPSLGLQYAIVAKYPE